MTKQSQFCQFDRAVNPLQAFERILEELESARVTDRTTICPSGSRSWLRLGGSLSWIVSMIAASNWPPFTPMTPPLNPATECSCFGRRSASPPAIPSFGEKYAYI